MVKALETSFKRIEKKYVLDKEKLGAIWDDLKEHLVEDDYPTSTITNIYFDTADFQVIQDSIAKKNGREKIRMRTYVTNPTEDSQAFLELKKKTPKVSVINSVWFRKQALLNNLSKVGN